MTTYRCESAFVDGALSGPVDIRCADGLIRSISPAAAGPADELLPGLVLPGFADAHSHVFHRALRGRTHGDSLGVGSFWTWRETMYSLADRLTPDTFHALAVASYAEMVCAGFTAVGEFHYLHHAPGGVPYADPNAMGVAAGQAAREVGIGLTLLDVAYLTGGFGLPLNESQQRFTDGSVAGWASRVGRLPAALPVGEFAVIRAGAAIHSVRAVPVVDLPEVARFAQAAGMPLHVHLSEQTAENEAALAATGRTPTQLLDDAGALSDRTAAVHATHLTDGDITLLGAARSSVVICPTTEADLADGLPRAAELRVAGAGLTLGGDQHVITDPFAQARGLEYGERLATGTRGTFSPEVLLEAATAAGHSSIGSTSGRIAVGAPADLVAVRTGSARTAGSLGLQLMMTASAADVSVVVVGGVVQARDGVHVRLGDPGDLLGRAIRKAWTG
ncbi:formimidoylglutamate deiminase [Nakamurella sp. PAMC28650]|uniref:formimidoylglutamate deiminase n=1 Tax=Nakamurella sp. PAMC28650 TaxID=2762325 RepID=UPI00164D655F|nr:formimidoylglutamate deiminase [Nakamurella sp. PAMC28650]QNK80803.1 formimidoylglutamate deiminase [Nakamurella sp. PAMC28650]